MGATRPFRRAEMWCQNGSREILQIAGRPRPAASLRSALDDDSHRPVVDQLNVHPRAEETRLDGDAERTQRRVELLEQRLGELRWRRVGEARPVPFPRVREQGELADDECRTAGV